YLYRNMLHIFYVIYNTLYIYIYIYILFFFSSRRRHTRFKCDWSSDVCSSDLAVSAAPTPRRGMPPQKHKDTNCSTVAAQRSWARSEERRVGKECRTKWKAYN